MKSKSYIQGLLDTVEGTTSSLIQDVGNNRPYVNQQYLIDRLEYIKQTTIMALERLQLEHDENY